MDAVNDTLYTPVQKDGKRYEIHFKSNGSQIVLTGIESFPELDISESDTALSAIEKLAKGKNNAGVFVTDIIIPTTGWTEQTVGNYSYYTDIANENIAEAMIPELVFSAENLKLADSYGISKACKTLDGKLRVYTIKIPQEEIPATLCLYGETKSISLPQGQLPLATATRAGMVKIGDNIDVTDDGTISVPLLSDKDGNGITDVIDNNLATDEDIDALVNEINNQ